MSEGRAALRVVAAGLQTTVQDLGRIGWARFGVAPGGALDDGATRWANLLVGNEPDAAAIEFALLGPTLTHEGAVPIVCALAGADFGATVDGVPRPPWRSFLLAPGATLACGACQRGARGYLAVAGGVAVPVALGSRSTDPRAGIGGVEGRALRAGDRVPLAPPAAPPEMGLALPAARIPAYDAASTVRVVLGPQDDRFTEDAIVTFLSSHYTVTREADRMGVRLDGPALAFKGGDNGAGNLSDGGAGGADIISEGVVTGAIQVPSHGRPIALLAARQTTGGYAKIATVIGADLWRLGQARPGDTVRFRAVPVAEAQELAARRRAAYDPALLVQIPWPRATITTTEEGAMTAERVGVAQGGEAGWTPEAVGRLLDRAVALDLTELMLEAPGVRLQLRRGVAPVPATTAAMPIGATPTPPESDAPAPTARADEFTVTAPLIGVFYRSARQGESPLVAPGDRVEADQPLGLIEVMKTFHEVTAGRPAHVVAVRAADATPVEYGAALFTLSPLE
jgi:biotin-dependent carboxylase-like uncharacterized protein